MNDVFHRIELVERYTAELLDPSPTSVFASGLFLAAPRRTGKRLNRLQELELVWRSRRGVYALEHPQLAALMRREGLIR